MLTATVATEIDTAVARLDAWLETMRGPDGYGGPVAHWWQQSLLYTGAGLDWRYEGIIAGYVQLWERTGAERWLDKARRAGDDLLAGQMPDRHYAASAFEINPAPAGTPHEAAADAGLLLLALALRAAGPHPPAPSPAAAGEGERSYRKENLDCGDVGWERYAAAAERNIRTFYVDQLWDAQARSFRDDPLVSSFVPNKAATACDALFLLAELTGDEQWVERYALWTLDCIVAHQVCGGPLDGAIAQNSFGARTIDKYFPIYIARCVPALLRGYRWSGAERYADCALAAMRFIARWVSRDGSLPTVVYPNRRVNRYLAWIAPLGDVLRAADLLRPFGFDADLSAMRQRLLAGQDATGGFQTATGFAAQAGGRPPAAPDVRDVLHVAGWCDKAFRYLAGHVEIDLPEAASAPFEANCVFRGQPMQLVETAEYLEIARRGGVCYRWRKGEPAPEIATMEFWLR
jgi:hypothetical protein